jgi:hypothetical protein
MSSHSHRVRILLPFLHVIPHGILVWNIVPKQFLANLQEVRVSTIEYCAARMYVLYSTKHQQDAPLSLFIYMLSTYVGID